MSSVGRFDVAILGGGLAANLLARQLRREVPGATVLMVDKDVETRWKVGESTVEIAAHYLVRRHGLGTYLLDRHLPKYGLRFFFDNEAKDAALPEMSEIGPDRPPPAPSFQLDRARFEADLRTMNVEAGVDVRLGTTVKRVEVGDGGQGHRVWLEGPDGASEVEARWLFDGTGRASVLAREKDLRVDVTERHPMSAIWGRFTGVVDFDHVGDEAWRGRVRHTTRTLSTNHFCYPGYWIWFIPLGRGVTSVGVVGDKAVFRRGMRTEAGFRAFLDEHRAVRELLADATPQDLEGYTQLAYGTKRFFDGAGRWGVLGDAAAFTDPFYSPGSDFISLECDYATDLVRRDLGGESPDEVTDVARTFDAFMQMRWQATLLLYEGLYSCFGSYELMRVKLNFDLGCYYNVWLDPFLLDRHRDPRFLMGELRRGQDTLRALENFAGLFKTVDADLRARGAYYDGNLGRYDRNVAVLLELLEEVGRPRKKRHVNRRSEEVFNYGRDESLKLLGRTDVEGEAPWRLFEFAEPPLARSLPSPPLTSS